MKITLTKPQSEFVRCNDMFPAMVAGYGSGKTYAAIWRALRFKFQYPEQNIAYYLPTYDLVTQIAYPNFADALERIQAPYQINRADKVIHVEGNGQIILRTMDRPERIVGYEVADSLVDELDTLPVDKAADVWRRIIARNRTKKPDGKHNTVGVATTPEGFRFVYEKWQRDPMPGSRIIKASTYSNRKNLPDGYIQALKDTYPSNMLSAYLDGEFVNLTQGTVYAEYDRDLNATDAVIESGETLHIGMDFNVGQMAAAVHVLRNGLPHAVDEIINVLDTPALIQTIKQRYPGYKIMAYPDASGKSRKSVNASESDIALLRHAGFTVCAHQANPFVKDRVTAFNRLLHHEGARKYRINIDRCPHLVEGLEKQAYDKNGEPDKTSGLDHVIDAAGYFVAYKFPVRGTMQTTRIGGI